MKGHFCPFIRTALASTENSRFGTISIVVSQLEKTMQTNPFAIRANADFTPLILSSLNVLSMSGEFDFSSPCAHTALIDGVTSVHYIHDGDDAFLEVLNGHATVLKVRIRSRLDFDVCTFQSGDWQYTLLDQHPVYRDMFCHEGA